MHSAVTSHAAEIAALCRRFGAARLDLFGSALRSDFNPAQSDFDFMVEFAEAGRLKAFDNFFGLMEDLELLLGRKVDLITNNQLRNPYFKQAVLSERQVIYAT